MLSPTFSAVLAIVVALASLFLLIISFVAPRLYRAQDLWWSGVGMFYALVLWFCSVQIRGAVLLGTIANVALLGWLGTQVYLSRWSALTDAEKANGTLKRLQSLGKQLTRILESRPTLKSEPKPPKTGKVRWVRPEKSEQKETAAATSASPELSPDTATEPMSLDTARSEIPEGEVSNPERSEPLEQPQVEESSADEIIESSTVSLPIVNQSQDDPIQSDRIQNDSEEWDEMDVAIEAAEIKKDGLDGLDRLEAAPSPPSGEYTKMAPAAAKLLQRVQNFLQGQKSYDQPPEAESETTNQAAQPIPEAIETVADLGQQALEDEEDESPTVAEALTETPPATEADLNKPL